MIILTILSQIEGTGLPLSPGGRQRNNRQNLIILLIIEGPYEIIETGSPASESTILPQLVSKNKSGVVSAPTSNLPYELKNTVGKDVMSIRGPLDLAFSIEAVEDVLNLNLLPGVRSTRSSHLPALVSEFLFQLFMSKSNVIFLVPIVFIEQGKTPVHVTIIDFSLLPIAAEIDLSLEGDSASWSWSECTLTLCILTMPYMYQFPLL